MTWTDFPHAPAPGTKVCDAEALVEPAASFDLDGFPLLIVRSADGLRGFVNACPHQYLPLDWRSPRVLSPEGTLLRCSNHDAGFDARTGEGVDGFGEGCALDRVPIHIEGEAILIGEDMA